MEVLDRFTTDLERLAGEQRELSKASTQAKKAAGRADTAVAKLHKRIADLEEQKQVRLRSEATPMVYQLEFDEARYTERRT